MLTQSWVGTSGFGGGGARPGQTDVKEGGAGRKGKGWGGHGEGGGGWGGGGEGVGSRGGGRQRGWRGGGAGWEIGGLSEGGV